MAELISGKLVSAVTREKIKQQCENFERENGFRPGLAVIQVGDNPASSVYVRNKHKACLEVSMNSFEIKLPVDVPESVLLSKIEELNNDPKVNGILVQLPLPKTIDSNKVLNLIDPKKDVDAFHPYNVGKILQGKYDFLPCTPSGIMTLLDYYNIELDGKNCVVVGRSNIVGKPMALLLLERNATVTVCHSHTEDLKSVTKKADVLVVAIGKGQFINSDYVKKGAVVIDVGMNRNAEGKLVGDVDFESVSKVASYITPVPGGVGPMTITTLLKNTLKSAELSVK